MKITTIISSKAIRRTLLISSITVVLAACGSEQESAAPATTSAVAELTGFETQVAQGADLFATNCAACHGTNLEGTTLGPILSGNTFLQRWGSGTPTPLLNSIQTNMPPGGGSSLTADDYLSLTAHILSENGMDTVTESLTASSDLVIQDNVSAIAARRQRPAPPAPEGVTVAGNVDDFVPFVPVTDAILENPADGDWPMHRRTYDANSYSPLDEINTENVGQLKLEWVWNMHEGDRKSVV